MRLKIFFILIVLSSSGLGTHKYNALGDFIPKNEACAVMRVDEGNLFYCETRNLQLLKVKLLGVAIDNYKQVEAKEFTKSILKNGTVVYVSLDYRVRIGKGVISSFVYLQDKTFLNGYIIRQGYGYESFEGNESRYKKQFEDIYYKDQRTLEDIKESIKEDIDTENKEKAPWLR